MAGAKALSSSGSSPRVRVFFNAVLRYRVAEHIHFFTVHVLCWFLQGDSAMGKPRAGARRPDSPCLIFSGMRPQTGCRFVAAGLRPGVKRPGYAGLREGERRVGMRPLAYDRRVSAFNRYLLSSAYILASSTGLLKWPFI